MKKPKVINLKKAKTLLAKFKKGKTYYIRIGEVQNGKIKWSKVRKLAVK